MEGSNHGKRVHMKEGEHYDERNAVSTVSGVSGALSTVLLKALIEPHRACLECS